jgi:basic amino acid/polyamine antiporter, APA family
MTTAPDPVGDEAERPADIPIFTRNSTGLVREVGLVDMTIFNAVSTSPIGAGLVFALFALVVFPRGNPYIAFVVALALSVLVSTTFALLSAAIPRIGGDYTINSRILHPWLGFTSNLCVFISTVIAAGLWAWWFGTQAFGPAFTVIGSVTGSSTFTRWGNDLLGGRHNVSFVMAVIALAIVSLLAVRGTRVVMRVMSILFLIAAAGFVIDMGILLVSGHSHFRSTIDSTFGAGTYAKTVHAAHGSGVLPAEGGWSTKNTFGAISSMLAITVFVFWGTYMSAEFKGAGQRKRQLVSMVGAGVGQGILVLIGMLIFLTTVGYSFFASSQAGNFTAGSSAVGTAGYPYFSALVANNSVFVGLLAIAFIGWWLPGLYINMAMLQRALLSWAFDGLVPKRLGDVNDRTHTPVVAIVVTFLGAVATAAWVSYGSNFFRQTAFIQLFIFVTFFVTGVSAVLVKRRRPDIYEASPAQWRLGGIEVLPVAGVGCMLVGVLGAGLILYFHENLGITGGYYTSIIVAPIAVFVGAGAWWWAAKRIRAAHGIDLALAYRALPPE